MQQSSSKPTGSAERNSESPAGLDLHPEMLHDLTLNILDRIERHLAALPGEPVAPDTSPSKIRALLSTGELPEHGEDPLDFVPEAADFLFRHSTFNGHPRFFGYITSSAAPIGALADFLAAAINPNVGAWSLSPAATEIEAQVVRWIAQLVGYPTDCGGLLVSGGNMANITCALAARRASANWDVRRLGMMHPEARPMAVYATAEMHTWLEKAVDIMGLGTDSIRRIATDRAGRMSPAALREAIEHDQSLGILPMLVVVTAGTVGTGVVDPVRNITAVCRDHDLWLHVDGAYGGLAAVLPEAPDDLHALSEADSVAIDPHKWLFSPLEAGCVLVRRAEDLRAAFSYKPSYYHFDGEAGDEPVNYYEWGLQNSRGFRALKVWFILRQLGRSGCAELIRKNIELAGVLHRAVDAHPLLEALTLGLSISTFRFIPEDLRDETEREDVRDYLNRLNENLLTALQHGGEMYLSNAIVDGRYALRACIVNFRTRASDVQSLPAIIAEQGIALDKELRER